MMIQVRSSEHPYLRSLPMSSPSMMRDTYVHGPIWLKRHRKTVEENATEAKVIVMYERVMRHMELVVKTQDNTTRLAYFVKLKQDHYSGTQSHTCMGLFGCQRRLRHHSTTNTPECRSCCVWNVGGGLEKVFVLPVDVSCQCIYWAFVDEVQYAALWEGSQTNTCCKR